MATSALLLSSTLARGAMRRAAPSALKGLKPMSYAGVTHTLSAAVFMLELTGRFELVLPLLLGATASVAVSRRLRANGIFDAMIYSKASAGARCSPIGERAPAPLRRREFLPLHKNRRCRASRRSPRRRCSSASPRATS